MRYKVEFFANGELQIVKEMTPEQIQMVTETIKNLTWEQE